jgi:phospho-N-acetylmuramoyl-pentapeptide-transferase
MFSSNNMALYLGILIFSFIFTSVAIVPFIDFLYRLRFTRRDERSLVQKGDTEAFRKLHEEHSKKVGTPIGGGILIIASVVFLYMVLMPIISRMGVYITTVFPLKDEVNIIFFTFVSFGLLGLYDDLVKMFGFTKSGFFGLRVRHKFLIQIALAFAVSLMMYLNLKIDIFYIPYLGVLKLGWWYVPLSTFIIVSFTNAFDITDGLDGLSCGVLLVCLLVFWAMSVASLDTPLSVFVALWIGALIAFLYFNVYPARIWLGNAGGLAFGATLAVVGLLLGKAVALVVIGGIFMVELLSSFLQIASFKLTGKRLFAIAPFHHWLQIKGWEEPKIVMRAWLAAIMLAIFGLWLAQL